MNEPALRPAMPFAPSRSTVAIVINCYNDLHFLPDAIESALAQTAPIDEIIVVDDGSTDDPKTVVAAYPSVCLIVQANAGLAAARNTGLAATDARYVAFLDADDRLLPGAIAANLACLEHAPAAGFAFGAHRQVDVAWHPLGRDNFNAVGAEPFVDFLRGNCVGMHAAVLYRSEALRRVGGFDETLGLCEDYDVYLRIARRGPVACHSEVVAEYRQHASNTSHRQLAMLDAALGVHGSYRPDPSTAASAAWHEGRGRWIDYYRMRLDEAQLASYRRTFAWLRAWRDLRLLDWRLEGADRLRQSGVGRIAGLARRALRRFRRWPPRVGRVDVGDFGATRPVSADFGFDRGLPIDRYYIDDFLHRHRFDVRGTVLEVGDAAYSTRFGGARVSVQEVLHVVAGNPLATRVGDLADPAVLPDAAFDCIILTQTLHLIYDVRQAVERLREVLAPGGVALVTVPGITPIDRGAWKDVWYWSFTRQSIVRMFGAVFGADNIEVEVFGNVYAATLYLQGLATAEVDEANLQVVDEAYPVIVAVRARRAP